MMFDAAVSVQSGLQILAQRLDLIITRQLAATLNGLEWTVILRELDSAKGYVGKRYSRTDMQAQLRMITERLGSLGYPFDDDLRTVSTLGSELRIIRNLWAHNSEIQVLDAWRAHDFTHRLLEYFGDTQGVVLIEPLRQEALRACAAESGALERPATQVAEPVRAFDAAPTSSVRAEEVVRPAPQVLVRANAQDTPRIGSVRQEYEPWIPVLVGDKSVLDALPKKVAKEQVRAVAAEIVEFEGPIHIDRLAGLTAAAFGLDRMHAKRRQQVTYQIKVSGLEVDGDKFVWPEHISRETWAEFRPNSSDADRPFDTVSPVEIGNAARFIKDASPGITVEELEAQTLQTFGRKRRTAAILQHLRRGFGG